MYLYNVSNMNKWIIDFTIREYVIFKHINEKNINFIMTRQFIL